MLKHLLERDCHITDLQVSICFDILWRGIDMSPISEGVMPQHLLERDCHLPISGSLYILASFGDGFSCHRSPKVSYRNIFQRGIAMSLISRSLYVSASFREGLPCHRSSKVSCRNIFQRGTAMSPISGSLYVSASFREGLPCHRSSKVSCRNIFRRGTAMSLISEGICNIHVILTSFF